MARSIRQRTIKSGKFDELVNVITRTIARKSEIESKGVLKYTEGQWLNEMARTGATLDESRSCWKDSKDRFGQQYPKKL